MPESIQTLVKHIGRINRNELNLQYTYVYAKLRYKNRARIFSSVVDSSLKKALVFCYDTDIGILLYENMRKLCTMEGCNYSQSRNSKICATLNVLNLANLFLMIFNE